jgi:hypothetical protein
MRWRLMMFAVAVLAVLQSAPSTADEVDDLGPELKPRTARERREHEALRAAYFAFMACGEPSPDTDPLVFANCLVQTEGDLLDAKRGLDVIGRRSRYRAVKRQLSNLITDQLADMPRVHAWILYDRATRSGLAASPTAPRASRATTVSPTLIDSLRAPTIGTPTSTGYPKTVYVHPYTRTDGTHVDGHYRSAPHRR